MISRTESNHCRHSSQFYYATWLSSSPPFSISVALEKMRIGGQCPSLAASSSANPDPKTRTPGIHLTIDPPSSVRTTPPTGSRDKRRPFWNGGRQWTSMPTWRTLYRRVLRNLRSRCKICRSPMPSLSNPETRRLYTPRRKARRTTAEFPFLFHLSWRLMDHLLSGIAIRL
jgi:hypothetical protein